jgi:hypothetical protein
VYYNRNANEGSKHKPPMVEGDPTKKQGKNPKLKQLSKLSLVKDKLPKLESLS